MKRSAAFLAALALLMPVFASAQTASTPIPSGPSPLQLLTAVAQLGAQAKALSSSQPLACNVLFSAPTVAIGQSVDLAWGSVGALDPEVASTTVPMWIPNGGSVLSFTQAGTWTYSFTFYNAQNATTTCTAKIVVTK